MNEDKMLKEEILDVLAKQLNGGEMVRIYGGAMGDLLEYNIDMGGDEETKIYFKEPLFNPNPELLSMTKKDWEEITEDVFQKVFKKSAVKRTKFAGLTRNIDFLK